MNWNERQQALGQARAVVRGESVAVPSATDGAKLRKLLAVPKDRMLVLRPGGDGMARIVTDRDVIEPRDGDEFDDLPVGRWGT